MTRTFLTSTFNLGLITPLSRYALGLGAVWVAEEYGRKTEIVPNRLVAFGATEFRAWDFKAAVVKRRVGRARGSRAVLRSKAGAGARAADRAEENIVAGIGVCQCLFLDSQLTRESTQGKRLRKQKKKSYSGGVEAESGQVFQADKALHRWS